jgi:hypothetical protein
MSKLTGKCLSVYDNWMYENYPNNIISENCGYNYGMFERDLEQLTYILPEVMNNALIIDFFDSVGIYILLEGSGKYFYFIIKQKNSKAFHYQNGESNSRTKAITEAIIKANEIFNLNNL